MATVPGVGGARPLLPIDCFLLLLLLRLVEAGCPPGCVCASDILSCADQGLTALPAPLPASTATLDLNHNRLAALPAGGFSGLPRLLTLRLPHNHLARLEPGTFRNASLILRHLDLSSNRLRLLERHWFAELPALQELLLFNNLIGRVEAPALAGLPALRRLYLSHNLLTDFPFFSVQQHDLPHLRTLDLSSNRLLRLPLDDIAALPAGLQRALYLHNNTLTCDCATLALFRRWELRGFGSVADYRREHVCRLFGDLRASVRFLEQDGDFQNCSLAASRGGALPESSLAAVVGEPLRLDCVTPLRGGDLSYVWVLPGQAYVAPPGSSDGSLRVLANGTLEIAAVGSDGGGVYLCMVQDRGRRRNETWEVNVTASARATETEPFNTGFTTLLGCLASLALVLVYLYLTPCRCCCCCRRRHKGGAVVVVSGPNEAASAQSSILTPTPPATDEGPGRKVSNNKHVVFLEPIREQNGRLRGAELPPRLVQSQRGDADSVVSVFSQTPIVP